MSSNSSGERTEKATPKKRQDARKEGQLLRSTELNTAFMLLLMFGVLQIFGGSIMRQSGKLFEQFLAVDYSGVEHITVGNLRSTFITAVINLLLMIWPFLAAGVIGGVLINVLQTGPLFLPSMLKPKFSRMSPLQGFKRMFSTRSLVEMVKSTAKIVVLAWIVYSEINGSIRDIPKMMGANALLSGKRVFSLAMSTAFKVGIALAIIALFDYIFQWWKYEKDLRMTKQEVKDEYKQIEGNPLIKGQIRKKQREIGMMRMMQSVPSADVVITNPTHYAVALQYDERKHAAPTVVAKGKDFIALKIREKAKECQIDIVENKAVAQALYFYCEVGDVIPEDMYQAVAEILAYLYRIKHRHDRRVRAGGAV